MTVHLVKLAVGVESTAHLAELQKRRLSRIGRKGPGLRHVTRSMPRRREEILDGGSIYWVIGGLIRVRQRLVSVDRVADGGDGPRCALGLDPGLIRVEPRARGPFQGWRYLEAADAPPDLPAGATDAAEMPADMAAALRDLGLL